MSSAVTSTRAGAGAVGDSVGGGSAPVLPGGVLGPLEPGPTDGGSVAHGPVVPDPVEPAAGFGGGGAVVGL